MCVSVRGTPGTHSRKAEKFRLFIVSYKLNTDSFAVSIPFLTVKFYNTNLAHWLMYKLGKGAFNDGTTRTSHVMIH